RLDLPVLRRRARRALIGSPLLARDVREGRVDALARPRAHAWPAYRHEVGAETGHASAEPVLNGPCAADPDRVRGAPPVDAEVLPAAPAARVPHTDIGVGKSASAPMEPDQVEGPRCNDSC